MFTAGAARSRSRSRARAPATTRSPSSIGTIFATGRPCDVTTMDWPSRTRRSNC